MKVDGGMFASERSVSFEGVGQTYHLVVDESAVQDGKLEVGILDEAQDTFLVALPTDTFTTGSTVCVPREVVEVA